MFELFERAQTLLAERVPLADHIEDDVVVMKDNGVMAAYEVAGRYPGYRRTGGREPLV